MKRNTRKQIRTDRHRTPAIVFLAVLFAATTSAQVDVPLRLNLEEAVESAISRDPTARKADVGIRVADLKIGEARSSRKPFVQLDHSFRRSNNPVFVFGSLLEQGRFAANNFALDPLNHPDPINNFRTSLSARYTVYDQGQSRSLVAQARNSHRQAELLAEWVRQRLTFNVIRSYFGVVLANEMLKVTDQAERSASENLRKARDMVEVGMVMESDSLAADVEHANTKQRALEARSVIAISTAALNIATGNAPGKRIELAGTLQEKYLPVEDEADLLKIALEMRPDYLASEIAVLNTREQSRSVRDSRRPRVEAFASYGYSGKHVAGGSSDYTLGASVSYNVFDAGRKYREAEAAESESRAELEREALANEIRFDVIRSFNEHRTARSKIEVTVRSIAQAEEALRIIHDRYKFGLTTFNEVLRAEAALTKAKHDLLSARNEYLVSYASLMLATGRLTDVRPFEP